MTEYKSGDGRLSHSPLNHLLSFVWKHSPFYRNLYSDNGIRENDLPYVQMGDLSTITKSQVIRHFDELVTDPRIRRKQVETWLDEYPDPGDKYLGEFTVIKSTGSSSETSLIVYDPYAWKTMTASAAPLLWPQNLSRMRKVRNAYYIGQKDHVASATMAAQSSDLTFERLVVGIMDPFHEMVEGLNSFQPDRLTSYSSAVAWLADLQLAGKLNIAPRDVVVSSDRLLPSMARKIREAWNANIYDLYAACESLFLALKAPGEEDWRVMTDMNLIEVLKPDGSTAEPGETGRVYLTNLYNYTTPIIRYDLTDYAVQGAAHEGASISLRGFKGRNFDNLPVMGEGAKPEEIPSTALTDFSDRIGADLLQFVTHAADRVEILYCAEREMDAPIANAFQELLRQYGAVRTAFTSRRVDQIWNDQKLLKLMMVRKPEDLQLGVASEPAIMAGVDGEDKEIAENSDAYFPRSNLDMSIPVCFERQVEQRGEATAVVDGAERLTYAVLNRLANRIAHTVLNHSLSDTQPVGLVFSHCDGMIAAILGVLKAGRAYLPLDLASSPERALNALRSVDARILVTNTAGMAALSEDVWREYAVLNIDKIQLESDAKNPGIIPPPEAAACILFTSGSTGEPKGVVLDHRAVLHRVLLYAQDYHITSADRMALLQSYVFNASLREIFGALLCGAELHLFNIKQEGVHHLAHWLREWRITTVYMVPALFRAFLKTLDQAGFPSLRLIRMGGEAVLPRDVEGFQRYFNGEILLANGFAATETGTTCQYFIKPGSRLTTHQVPAGFPVRDKTLWFEDENGVRVEPGVVGELVVESSFLGPGYYPAGIDQVEGGTRIFHTGDMGYQLADGCVYIIGRKDALVKIRAQRINLNEVENAILQLNGVQEAAVVARAHADGGTFLSAYLKIDPGDSVPIESLRVDLRNMLPENMVPTVWTRLDELPKTAGGKINRLALTEAEITPPSVEPVERQRLNRFEAVLVEIWKDVLGIGTVDPERSFFDQGGDSLIASVLMARIEAQSNQQLPLALLIRANTVRKLARVLAEEESKRSLTTPLVLREGRAETPMYLIPGIGGELLGLHEIVAGFSGDEMVYGLRGDMFNAPAREPVRMEDLAASYVQELLAFQPAGRFFFAGYSFGGHLALEIGRQLTALGREVVLVALLDTLPLDRKQTTFARRLKIHLGNLRRMRNLRALSQYVAGRLRSLYLRFLRWRAVEKPGEIGASTFAQLSAGEVAQAIHHPLAYTGDVLLIQAKERDWYVDWDPMLSWREAIQGRMRVVEVDAGHDSLIENPAAGEVARLLSEALENL